MSDRKVSKAMFWLSHVVGTLPTAVFFPSAFFKLTQPEMMKGWPTYVPVPLGIVELVCVILHYIPKTTVLGAVLLTGYLGGAICVHVQAGEPFAIPAVIGVLIWLGLFMRTPALRALLPIKR